MSPSTLRPSAIPILVLAASAIPVDVCLAQGYEVSGVTEHVVHETSSVATVRNSPMTLVNPEASDDDDAYDRIVIAGLDDEPEASADDSRLIPVEWVPGVGLVDRG